MSSYDQYRFIRVPRRAQYTIAAYQLLLDALPSTRYRPVALNSNTVYVPILKNANTWLTRYLEQNPAVITTDNPHYLVIVRDPIQRWITGTHTFFRRWLLYVDNYFHYKHLGMQHQGHEEMFEKFDELFSNSLILDQHTVPQWAWLEHRTVPRDLADFVLLDNSLHNYLETQYQLPNLPQPINTTKGNLRAEFFNIQLKEYIISRNLEPKLQEIYSGDYELLNRINQK